MGIEVTQEMITSFGYAWRDEDLQQDGFSKPGDRRQAGIEKVIAIIERDYNLEKKEVKMELTELKDAVINALVSDHDFLVEDASTMVDDSMSYSTGLWHENADPNELANILDSDDDED